MKTPARTLFLAAFASWMTLSAAALAQDNSAPAAPDRPAAAQPATPSDSSVATEPPAPATEQSPATEQPSEPAPQPAPEAESSSELRRIDQPAPEAVESSDAADAGSAQSSTTETESADQTGGQHRHEGGSRHNHGNERVSMWQDSTLGENEEAGAVVSIIGSSTSAGKVHDAVVSILGSSTSSGEVANAVVSVCGSSRVTAGSVGDAVVSVLGNTYVNGRVGGEVVAVMGNVELGPQADVHGDVVCVGGKVIRDPAAKVHGQVNNVAMGFSFGGFEWLHAWVSQCLLYGRPLAFGPNLMWAWWVAIGFLAFYMILAALFPRGIVRCAETLEQRPGFSVLTAFLVTLLAPAAVLILAITLVGAPVLMLGLFVAGLFGKAVMFAWVGRRITRFFGEGPLAHAFFAVAIGGVIVLLLYTIPIGGFVVLKLTSWLGVGVVVYTLIQLMQRNKPPRPAMVASGASMAGAAGVGVATAVIPPVAGANLSGVGAAEVPPATAIVASAPISAVTQPRAGFWIRFAAFMIDAIVVAVVVNLFPDRWEPNPLLTFMIYCSVFWALKATTLGGAVCSLKVVRLDDRKLDWPTAIVRTLGGFVSLIPAGLGFIWVAFDDQRQSWHDKIAGTTVVYVPRGMALL